MADRIPPQDLDIERALLGAIMLNGNAMYEVVDIIHPDSFYASKHRIIYDGMLALYGKGEPVDIVSLSGKLKERKQLDNVGGSAYLSELANATPSTTSVRHYAQVVQSKAMLRALIEAASHISELGFQEERGIEEVLDEAQSAVFAVANSPTLRKFISLKETLSGAWERFEALQKQKDGIRGVPTGFPELDSMLSGLQNSDLIILAARPSMGKTSLALDIARRSAVKHGTPVGLFSLEMSSQQLVDRMLAAEASVDSWKLRTGKIRGEEDYHSLQMGIERLSDAPIYIDDNPGATVLQMRATARRLKSEKGLGLIMIDYLQLITPTNTRSNDSMVQQVTEISRSLKMMARELDVPVLALSQLSRAVEQRRGRPRLSDLRDSGCLSGDTMIVNAKTGERHTMRELAEKRAALPVFALDEHFQLHMTEATRFFSSGMKKLYTLTTRSGRTIRASANHPFKTIEGWKSLDALAVGEHIAVPRSLTLQKATSPLSHDELIFIAHLLGDGCILPRQPYHYTTASPMNRETVEHMSARLFGIAPRAVRQKNWWHIYFPSPYRLARGKHHPITKWFEKLGIERSHSYDKRIPEAVFGCSDAEIALFLKHLWSTDGNVSLKLMKGRSDAASIYYASSSKVLADQVAHLLLRLSLHAVVRAVPSKKYRTMYHVHVEGAKQQIRFLTVIGIADERKDMIPELLTKLGSITPNTNIDVTPKEAWRLVIAPALHDADMSWRDLSAQLGVAYNGTAMQRTGIGRDRLSAIATILKSPLCLELATAHVLWDPIVSIEEGSEEEVFDATVPGLHNFVADDIVVHNSIEQDADVVMFIHREDMMGNRTDEGKNNVAEILIEKHRNGPVGKVDLFFDEKRASFNSIEKNDFGDFEQTPAHVEVDPTF